MIKSLRVQRCQGPYLELVVCYINMVNSYVSKHVTVCRKDTHGLKTKPDSSIQITNIEINAGFP